MTPRAYHVTFDQVSAEEWAALLPMFEDATIYQSFGYGIAHWGEKRLSHAVLTRADGTVCGMAQITLFPAPFGLPFGGVAYASYGPIVKRAGEPLDPQAIAFFLKALRDEYVTRRKGVLRLMPYLPNDDTSDPMSSALETHGFSRVATRSPGWTIVLDLTLPSETIRAQLDKTWRSSLSKAERSELTLIEGDDADSLGLFARMYEDMLARKQFAPGVDYREFLRAQDLLPPPLKMRAFIALQNGTPINALLISAVGRTGHYLLGATASDAGKGANGSYLLQWRVINWLKDQGVTRYDLSGIDPKGNPNVTRFKFGLLGKGNGAELRYLGFYQTAWSPLFLVLLTALERGKALLKKIKNAKKDAGH